MVAAILIEHAPFDLFLRPTVYECSQSLLLIFKLAKSQRFVSRYQTMPINDANSRLASASCLSCV